MHGTSPEEVHFHEVGALDAIADVVGVCAGLVHLGLEALVVSPVAVGSGQVHGAHGVMPVPPPAVVELLRGVPSYAGPGGAELCTPTGAALLTTHASSYGPQPPMAVEAVGVGAGGRDPDSHANVLRLLVGERSRGWSSPGGRACRDPRRARPRDQRRRPGPAAVAQRARGAAGGRRLGRLADPDPDEEGPAGAHAERAGAADRADAVRAAVFRADLDDRDARELVAKTELDREMHDRGGRRARGRV